MPKSPLSECHRYGRKPTARPLVHLFAALWLIGVASAPLAAGAPAPGLIGRWDFELCRGDLAEDASGNGNTAELLGARWARGTFGGALHFAGADSFVTIPQLPGLDGSNELSVEAWVLWEAGGRHPNIVTGGQWCPGGFMIFVRDKSCSFRMGRPGPERNEPGHVWQETSVPFIAPFDTGRWYHLAATFKRPILTTYVNGKRAGSTRWDQPVGYRGDLRIGHWNGGKSCHRGLIDELAIFNRARSAEEIAADYAAGAPRRLAPDGAAYRSLPAAPQPVATIENELAKLQIDRRGRCIALVERSSGRDLLARPAPMAAIRRQDALFHPTTCTYEHGEIRLGFGPTGAATVVLGCTARPRSLVFTVRSVEGEGIDALTFLTLALRPGKRSSPTSGALVDDDWGVCLRALNLQTEVHLGGAPTLLRASSTAEHGLAGAKAALVVTPADQLRPALRDMIESDGLPKSALGGPWALDAEEIRGAYLFANPSERDVARWIDLAKRGGFTHLHHSGWYQTLGHYEPRATLFPSGIDGVKRMVDKIHSAGLKAGMHTLTGCIAPSDAWVTPVPDRRLAADASYTLARDVDAGSDAIYTVEAPGSHDVIWSYSGSGNALRIGDEIIQYAAIASAPPHGFLKCTRGAFKTRAGAHRKGERVDHLRQRYIAFYPDERSTLVDEVAGAIARVYNQCGFDQIYMDGAEGMGSTYAIQRMRDAIYRRLKRPAVVEASCWDHWSWYYHSRIGAWDHPKWGLKPFTDRHCAAIADYRQGALLQAQLGWWVVLGPSQASRAETPDEMEYYCAKTLGFDAPSSIQGIGALGAPANARMQEYITMAGWYERLRLARYFPEPIKEQLREPGKDFHLNRTDAGDWQLSPVEYLAHKVAAPDDGSAQWTITNKFAPQPLRLRLEALYCVAPQDDPDKVRIAGPGDPARFTVRRAAQGVTHTLDRVTDPVKADGASLRFAATNNRSTRQGAWAHAGTKFDAPYLDIGPCDALGVWVHGDGKGELLNVQLTSPREYSAAVGEHYLTIDFRGWRRFEIPLRERDAARHSDYQWPYSSSHGIYMTSVNRAHVDALNLYLNNLPLGDTAAVCLGPIEALRTNRTRIGNPAVTLNGRKIVFPATLTSGDFIELDSDGECRVYDERGALRERRALPGPLPILKTGANQLAFSCEPPDTGRTPRIEITAIASGPPLEGRTPTDQIDWEQLRDEYDAPRVMTKIDGAENAWTVTCRKGEGKVPFGVEIDIEEVRPSDAAYNGPDALTLESFDNPAFFTVPAAGPVYDATSKITGANPGVTHTLAHDTDRVKTGGGAARCSATSTRPDNSGWSVRGARRAQPIDLSGFRGVGFWVHGDGKGEALKLQLRDSGRGWCDMVTRIDFVGWRYQQFDFGGAGNLDRAKVRSVLLYFNGIPAKTTVTCHIDDIRALPTSAAAGLRNPELTIGTARLAFPVELFAGDHLAFDGTRCRVHRRDGSEPESIAPRGAPVTLDRGRTAVVLSFDSPLPQFRAAASLVKRYP